MTLSELARADATDVPPHVPAERIAPYDLLRISEPGDDPFEVMNSLRAKGPIFYTPVHFTGNAGAWVITRSEDIRYVLGDPGLFSSKGASGFPTMLGDSWQMTPLEIDPPRHGIYRRILNPMFSPSRMMAMREAMRASCRELLDAVVSNGECEFMASFARPFPIRIFLQLFGLPLDLYAQFMEWNNRLLFSPDQNDRIDAARDIRDYLRQLIADRKRSPSGQDLMSMIVRADADGVPLTDDEMLGICYLLFVGGLDTVAASLGFFYKHLAENPGQQRFLRENPKLIPEAIEELLRAHSVVMMSRVATMDTQIAGQPIRAGEWVSIYSSFASLDPESVDRPQDVDFGREIKRHIAFSSGPHRCLGAHLARIELTVALEEWLKRVPPWRIKDDHPPRMHGGVVFGLDELTLSWA
jgi:cytochrome P450